MKVTGEVTETEVEVEVDDYDMLGEMELDEILSFAIDNCDVNDILEQLERDYIAEFLDNGEPKGDPIEIIKEQLDRFYEMKKSAKQHADNLQGMLDNIRNKYKDLESQIKALKSND